MTQNNSRQKHRFPHFFDVAKLWANQSQDRAHCRNGFFESKQIWSYGRHYLLGVIFKYRGHDVALINSTGYSKTTNGHISDAFHCASEVMPTFKIPFSRTLNHDSPEAEFMEALLLEQRQILDNFFDIFLKVKIRRWNFDIQIESFIQFNETCKKLGLNDLALEFPADLIELREAHCMTQMEATEAHETQKQIKMEIADNDTE